MFRMQNIISQINQLPLVQQKEMLKLLEDYEEAKTREQCRASYMPFVKEMWAAFIEGNHHSIMAEAFERFHEVN